MSQGHRAAEQCWVISDLTQNKEKPRNNRGRCLKYVYFINCPELAGMFIQVMRPTGPEAMPRPPLLGESASRGPANCPPRKHLCSEEAISQGPGAQQGGWLLPLQRWPDSLLSSPEDPQGAPEGKGTHRSSPRTALLQLKEC